MLKLVRFLKPYLPYIIAAPLFMLLEVLMDIYLPRLMADIVDVGIVNRDFDYVLKMGVYMVIISLIGVASGMGGIIFSTLAGQYFSRDVRSALFKKVQGLSFTNVDKLSNASIITRLTNDVTQIQQIVMTLLSMMVRASLLIIGGIVMAYSLNKELASIFWVIIPFIILILIVTIIKGLPLFKASQEKLDRLNLVVRENLAGVRVVKAFMRETLEKEKFGAANKDLKAISFKTIKVAIVLSPASMTIMNLSIVAVLWFGGMRVSGGSVSVGVIMAYINYLTQILASVAMLSNMIVSISRGKVSADRINEVLDTKVDIISPAAPSARVTGHGEVEFKSVLFRYPESTGNPVLTNISFSVKRGETVGILGQTGAGKTTLVSLIPRLYDVSEGAVLVNGLDVREYDLESLRKRIGFVLQQSILFKGTIKENIKWGNPDATDNEVEEAARIAQSHEFILQQENGYNTEIKQAGINLSGGQKQRLAIARALLKKPEILILDDSTSAVDTVTEARLQKAMRNEFGNCTKFIIAQRISSVIKADKIIVLEGGAITAIGSHQHLLYTSEVYRDIYSSQEKEKVLVNE
ncbi:ABC transporter ATP-binding protein [Clostridium sp. DJ247]|uniref:ABC transporter ATP-binding protein n=1 Tax=Clostridium sp. DJ247 TaxID=2726188 RepID=UPI00162A7717|nr:ABC transporter ATP-binding protein [Clostridium sp. DJ247]MBC2579233.1 ABC transporter ATP-binding protein [Clostridium sp. DJ247]MBC2579316.1 ABC transporter ATP-binding protein [Clostridium sp. DJ247]